MNRTRRDFLSSASRSVAWAIISTALAGCAGSPNAKPKHAWNISTLAGHKPIRPAPGKVLFIAGQEAGHLGGRPSEGMGDGYLDHVPTRPGGFTLYCSVSGAADLGSMSRVCNLPALKDSVLHLSVSWVADSDLSTRDNNRLLTTGAFDKHIDRLAEWCAAHPRPILLRLGYEFDRGLPFPNFHYDPAYFAQGFRRIVDRFRVARADNVSTVLASTNFSGNLPTLTTEAFNRFYPGDDYVDWLGCSMWIPDAVDETIFNEARKRGKPVLLAETTPVKYNIGRSLHFPYYIGFSEPISPQAIWDNWHKPMIDFIKANADIIGAWHYIVANWSAESHWKWEYLFANCDARPWGNAEFLEIWNKHINSATFLQASSTLFHDIGFSRREKTESMLSV